MVKPSIEGDPILNPDVTISSNEMRRSRRVRTAAVIVAMIAVVVAADQLTKASIVAWLAPPAIERRWELLGPYLAFEYVENTGAAFGILAGRTWLLSVLALAVGCWFLAAYRQHLPYSVTLQVAVGLVLGGAVGNLFDRVRLGYVVDFVAVGPWPRFNVADSAITMGLILLFITVLRNDPNGSANE
jgi:signal peptidase II